MIKIKFFQPEKNNNSQFNAKSEQKRKKRKPQQNVFENEFEKKNQIPKGTESESDVFQICLICVRRT